MRKDEPALPIEGWGERRRRHLLSKEQALNSLQMLAPNPEETIQVVIGSPKKYEGTEYFSTKDGTSIYFCALRTK